MMKLPIFQVDAFTNNIFSGNPAAVIPLEYWLDEVKMQAIAAENNLSETAFFVNRGEYYHLRWFTPQTEVDLCGHATLASAYVIMNKIDTSLKEITFGTKSGELVVRRKGDTFSMDFPAHPPQRCDSPATLIKALGKEPKEVYTSNYYMAVYENEDDILNLLPYMKMLKELDRLAVIVTAPGNQVDFVSRFFAPAVGIPEDPVTGSAHCTLIPYWADRLKKTEMVAHQISQRGGEIFCEYKEKRVIIAGKAVMYLKGTIYI
jgi:PhzF family phenazine biosynthesis protein